MYDSIYDSFIADTRGWIKSKGNDSRNIYKLWTEDRAESKTCHELHDAHRDVPASEFILSRRYIEVRCI